MGEINVDQTTSRLFEVTKRMQTMAPEVAYARNVVEWEGERKKNLLAKYTDLISIKSHASAETTARANPDYLLELKELEGQGRDAREVIEKSRADHATHETGRTILSFVKHSDS